MKKAAFIIPYFGTLPAYFSEWKYSASFLSGSVDFIVITDDTKNKMLETIPENIFVKEMSFDGFKAFIQSKFDFEIQLPSPYKICDYRPAFGYIFEDMLEPYDFWGNCDLDQVWGNYKNFITDAILDNYEKILYLGHFSLHKNSERMRLMFMNDGGMADYKEVFSSKSFYAFDEFSGMIPICKTHNVKTYYSTIYADISVMSRRILLRRTDNYKKQIVYWKEGRIFRSYIEKGHIGTDEFLYGHFQKRKLKSIGSYESKPRIILISNDGFIDISEKEITSELIETYCDYKNEIDDKLSHYSYYLDKIKTFLFLSLNDKKIWIRRKRFTSEL